MHQLQGFQTVEQALATCQAYLLQLANDLMPTQLQTKFGASDIVQETMLAATVSAEQFRGTTMGEFHAWLRRILLHELAMLRRRYNGTKARDPRREEMQVNEQLLADAEGLNAVEALIAQEETERVQAAFLKLLPDHQRVIKLRVEEVLAFAEIGQQMNRSEDAARQLFGRAIDALKEALSSRI